MTLSLTPSECIVYASPNAVRMKLRSMGVPLQLLITAAQAGFVERLNAMPPFDPVTKAGTDAWTYPVRVLRNGLQEQGWRLDDPKNLPLAISDEKMINITVSSGDEITGVVHPKRQPKSKNPKGLILEAAIERNVGQGDMFSHLLPERLVRFGRTVSHATWVFLLYITDDEIRAELSLPNSLDGSDHINGWSERIILGVPLPGLEVTNNKDLDSGPDIVPEITAKI